MNLVSYLAASWRKACHIRQLGRQLGSSKTAYSPESYYEAEARRERAEQDLFDLVERDPTLRTILDEHEISRTRLRYIYRTLSAHGAGRRAGGHWVAASAIAYRIPLRFLLAKTNDGQTDDGTLWAIAVNKINAYFKRGGGFGLPPISPAAYRDVGKSAASESGWPGHPSRLA